MTIQRLTAWASENAVDSAASVPIYLEDIDDSGVFSAYESKRHKSSVCSDIIYKMRQRYVCLFTDLVAAKSHVDM